MSEKEPPVSLAGDGEEGEVSSIEEVDAADWVYRSQGVKLAAQTIYQQDEFSTTLLQVLVSADDDDLDDAYDRFSGSGRDRER